MSIDKKKFHEALLEANKNPNNTKLQTEAGRQLLSLASLLASKFLITSNRDDIVQEMATRAWQKRFSVMSAKGNAFNFYWTVMRNDMFKILKKEQKWSSNNYLHSALKYIPETAADELDIDEAIDMERFIIEKLDFSLADFKPIEERLESEKPTWVALDNGRVKVGGVAFASYIVSAYEYLKKEKVVPISKILEFKPEKKKLGNPESYMLVRLQVLAKSENCKVKLKDGETEKVLVFINQNE